MQRIHPEHPPLPLMLAIASLSSLFSPMLALASFSSYPAAYSSIGPSNTDLSDNSLYARLSSPAGLHWPPSAPAPAHPCARLQSPAAAVAPSPPPPAQPAGPGSL
eukprot:scaffold132976_cov22-Tisochrysis_lutea.AAC.2